MPVPATWRLRSPEEVPQVAAADEVMVRAPEEVDQMEAAPPVKVSAPPEVKEDAEVGVRLTAPAPDAVKFPEVRVKAMSVEEAVVMVAPPLYAFYKVWAEVTQVAQVMFPRASIERGDEAETTTVPVALGKVMVLFEAVGSVMAKMV